jgi:RHS repeat-associated protein
VREITNAAGVLVWRADTTEPFGANMPNENPSSLGTFTYNPRFPGQYFDIETGLHYNYYRDYDPQTGRYIESDPIGLGGGANTYGYVEQNPTLRVDPDGHMSVVVLVVPPIIVGAAIMMSIPDGKKAMKNIATKIAELCTPDPKSPCEEQQDQDEHECAQKYGRFFGWASPAYRGCMERARINADLCRRGLPRIPAWSDPDVTGEPPSKPRGK